MAGEQMKRDRAGAAPDEGGESSGATGGEVRATVAPGDAGDSPAPQHPLGAPPTTLTMPASQRVGGTDRVTVASLRENMLIIGTDGETLGVVDGPGAGNTVRLKPDALGQSHWVPLDWVARVDDQAHLDRPARQARQEWADQEPNS